MARLSPFCSSLSESSTWWYDVGVIEALPPAPAAAYDAATYRAHVGAYAGQIHEVRWGYYKGFVHGQVRRAIVRKRWFSVVVHTSHVTFVVRIQDNGTSGEGRLFVFDRETGHVIAKARDGAPLRTLVVGPDAGEGTSAFVRSGDADIALTRPKGSNAWTLAVGWQDVRAYLRLDATLAPIPSVVIGEACPPLAHRPALVQRATGLRVSGSLVVGGRSLPLANAIGEVSYYNAFLPTKARGRVLSAQGEHDGRPIALACTDGDLLGASQETTLFVDGRPYGIGPLTLDGRFGVRGEGIALSFSPRATASADTRRMQGLVHHESEWIAGDLDGTLTMPSGDRVSVSLRALAEDHALVR